jgi:hypothetical protein
LQLLDGHLHGGDDVPSGVAQRPIEVEYYQFCGHVIKIILLPHNAGIPFPWPFLRSSGSKTKGKVT